MTSTISPAPGGGPRPPAGSWTSPIVTAKVYPPGGGLPEHSNFIERTFGESRPGVRLIGLLLGQISCLRLVWAVLERASRGLAWCLPASETVELL
jgi:hypothetical protein